MKNAFNFDLKIRFHSTTTTNPRENLQNRTGTDRPQKVENFQKTKAFKNFLTNTKHSLQTSIMGLESSRKKQTRFYQIVQTWLFRYQKDPFIHPIIHL